MRFCQRGLKSDTAKVHTRRVINYLARESKTQEMHYNVHLKYRPSSHDQLKRYSQRANDSR